MDFTADLTIRVSGIWSCPAMSLDNKSNFVRSKARSFFLSLMIDVVAEIFLPRCLSFGSQVGVGATSCISCSALYSVISLVKGSVTRALLLARCDFVLAWVAAVEAKAITVPEL